MSIRYAVAFLVGLIFMVWLATPMCGCSTREGAYNAAMKSDLKNLASQQEIYFSDAGAYTDDFQELAFVNSDGTIVSVELVSETAWRARANHVALRDRESGSPGMDCVIYWGQDVEVPRTTVKGFEPSEPGVVACDRDKRPNPILRRLRSLW